MEDDLKKYEVHVGEIPIWYHRTIREFITNYCPDMHIKNKLLLLEILHKVESERKPVKQDKVVQLRKYG